MPTFSPRALKVNLDLTSLLDNEDKKSKNKRGVLPKHATNIMRSWLFQHLMVSACVLGAPGSTVALWPGLGEGLSDGDVTFQRPGHRGGSCGTGSWEAISSACCCCHKKHSRGDIKEGVGRRILKRPEHWAGGQNCFVSGCGSVGLAALPAHAPSSCSSLLAPSLLVRKKMFTLRPSVPQSPHRWGRRACVLLSFCPEPPIRLRAGSPG